MQFKQFVILATAFAPMAALLAGTVPVDVKRRDTPSGKYSPGNYPQLSKIPSNGQNTHEYEGIHSYYR
ncbi:uncharacterized protein C8Q71DRAFT_859852 [Rhodofomes roseus]|uniref:Uncharacterized protein n=1 Tax=Rhodofomes roseus TaxID=34475 RepID=A0ABQ8KBG0_9APHY|nr:uncharacterized protein C8Q71DRAFT_859852 [Rhodofomes roseus]KAH9834201.1 hypothetical protein C8Q71DRAFT_859852 [Rhodofomes roseus]